MYAPVPLSKSSFQQTGVASQEDPEGLRQVSQ
jgi:hypothetical protein